MKKNFIYLFISLALFLTGCESGLGDNFVDVEPQSGNGLQMKIYSNLPDDGTLLEIDDYYHIWYDIETPGHVFQSCTFRMGGKEWEEKEPSGYFVIYANEFPNNIYELTCEVQVKTGNGSIADQLGTEFFVQKQNWQVRVISRDPSSDPLANKVNEEGFLELSWDVDEKLRADFDHYEVVCNSPNVTHVLTNFDRRTYVDKSYGGGETTYEVYIYFKDVTARPYSLGTAVLHQIDPQVKMEYPEPGKVRVSWYNPYRSTVNVLYQGQMIAEKVETGVIEFPLVCNGDVKQRVELEFCALEWFISDVSFRYSFDISCGEISATNGTNHTFNIDKFQEK